MLFARWAVKNAIKKYVATSFVLVALGAMLIVVLQRLPPAPGQAPSHHEIPHRPIETAEATTHDTGAAPAYYQAESMRRMAVYLRRVAEVTTPQICNKRSCFADVAATRAIEIIYPKMC